MAGTVTKKTDDSSHEYWVDLGIDEWVSKSIKLNVCQNMWNIWEG